MRRDEQVADVRAVDVGAEEATAPEHLAAPFVNRSPGRRLRSPSFRIALAVVAVVALAIRLIVILWLRHRQLSGDGLAYHYAAIALRNGQGFVDVLDPTLSQTAHHPPVWTALLAIGVAFGFDTLTAHQILAAAIGVVAVVITGFAGRAIAGPRAGVIAAILAAVYPGFWVYEQALLSETALILGVALLILSVRAFRARPDWPHLALVGVMCGLLALVRSEQVLMAALLVPLAWRAPRPVVRRVGLLAVGVGAVALTILPWTLYNYSRLEDPVVLSSGYGAAAAQGNCDTAYAGPLLGYYDFRCLGIQVAAAARRGAPRPYADSTLREQAVRYARSHERRLPVVFLARQGRTWGFYRPLQTADLEAGFSLSPPGPFRAAQVGLWFLEAAAIGGAIVLRRRRQPLVELVAPLLVVVFTVTVTYGQPRLRAGADVAIVVFAAVWLDHVTSRIDANRWRRGSRQPFKVAPV